MSKPFITSLLTGLLITCCGSAFALKFDAKVPVAATYPVPYVDGNIYYKAFPSSNTAPKPFRNCVIIHGHGVTAELLNMISGIDEGEILLPEIQSLMANVPEFEGLSDLIGAFAPQAGEISKRVESQIELLKDLDALTLFSNFYPGNTLRDGLLSQYCEQVITTVQESTQTSILEMTVRTERFLKHACRPTSHEGQKACALIGHSKGGAVVTSIARRCMQAKPPRKDKQELHQGGSDMGEAPCRQIGLVYSSAGVVEGVGFGAVLLGATKLSKQKNNLEQSENDLTQMLSNVINNTQMAKEGMARLYLLKNAEKRLNIDILGPKTDKTNPTWFDLSPIASMDGEDLSNPERRFTIGELHGKDFVLKRNVGWFEGYYAASASPFDFSKSKEVIGYGTLPERLKLVSTEPDLSDRPLLQRMKNFRNRVITGALDAQQASEQDPESQQALETLGGGPIKTLQAELEKVPPLAFLLDSFNTAQYLACTVFSEEVTKSHHDPNIPMSFTVGLLGLKSFASQNHLVGKDKDLSYLNNFKLDRPKDTSLISHPELKAFQESDGFVEAGTALGLCQRSATKVTEKDNQAIVSCRQLPNINHLSMGGMAKEVVDDILLQMRRSVPEPWGREF